jgi:hypothetical protein
MNLESALQAMAENSETEFFSMTLNNKKLEIVELKTEVYCGTPIHFASFENLNLFEEDYVIDDDLLPVEDCVDQLADHVFVSKDSVPYFSTGYEGEHILFTVFPDLPDPASLNNADEQAAFAQNAAEFIATLFSY